ncbi:hypothetical protein QC763_0063010 [Podospora pseudopauciseta]|uniref:Uncharacterized protein n=1 Tax=Podospora pseudopauciseta TaxID=2093780 RepID=A0ABR0HBN2_9PEZI|nr:hypothetical protein QC763_0063010 [Podospora pseudopauciseta]
MVVWFWTRKFCCSRNLGYEGINISKHIRARRQAQGTEDMFPLFRCRAAPPISTGLRPIDTSMTRTFECLWLR